MKYNDINPARARLLSERAAAAIFEVMTNPAELRIVAELESNPRTSHGQTLRDYYLIDAAHDEHRPTAANPYNYETKPNAGGLWFVSVGGGSQIPDKYGRKARPAAVAQWLRQMIARNRLHDIWAESY